MDAFIFLSVSFGNMDYRKQCFLVCLPSVSMARKQCFLICLPSVNMVTRQCFLVFHPSEAIFPAFPLMEKKKKTKQKTFETLLVRQSLTCYDLTFQSAQIAMTP